MKRLLSAPAPQPGYILHLASYRGKKVSTPPSTMGLAAYKGDQGQPGRGLLDTRRFEAQVTGVRQHRCTCVLAESSVLSDIT
mmetsp:Transcript_21767/g.34106  ORF Transcript_21767/g.34106 Transcript_21767/m.34106 type:complete len:82 (-) Transcript_21767:648-893(-)